jgi:hypothetical protein
MRRLVRTTVVPILALLALAGCGQAADSAGDFKGEEKKVAQVIEDLQEYAQQDDAGEICETILDPDAVQGIPGGDCEKAMKQAIDEADNYDLTVDSVRVSGTTARARVKAGRDEDQVETIELRKRSDLWKITRLAG